MKLWELNNGTDQDVEAFTVGDDYILDQVLVPYDCDGSIAHAKMLHKIGVLKRAEAEALTKELKRIKELHAQDKFEVKQSDEDCHTAIENRLVKRLGNVGKKIHTARSRNDQVLTAIRLFIADKAAMADDTIGVLIKALEGFAKKHPETPMPGYTHMRKAMPSSVKMWATAYADLLKDDAALLDSVMAIIDQSPLGTGAGYGLPIKVDRSLTAKQLGFPAVQMNPIATQLSRGKFESMLLHTLGQSMLTINRLASDLILFSMPEFGYFVLPPAFCTGSSIMPQKQNPDVLELARAKYHVLVGLEAQVKGVSAGLPSGYNRDLQLTKGPVMRGLATVIETTAIIAKLIKNLKVDSARCKQAMTPELYATDKALKLVAEGIPFRDAYHKVKKELFD
ncbi:MAG: argininosuccinate lyase [archaeon]